MIAIQITDPVMDALADEYAELKLSAAGVSFYQFARLPDYYRTRWPLKTACVPVVSKHNRECIRCGEVVEVIGNHHCPKCIAKKSKGGQE